MKAGIKEIITKAVNAAFGSGLLKNVSGQDLPDVIVEKSKKEAFGDFSTNVAMLLAPLTKEPPRRTAEAVASAIAKDPAVEKCEVAGPGFINIFLNKSYWGEILTEMLKKGAACGRSNAGKGKKVLLEFVSANPTGPLHIGHGRGAAVGDSLARIMAFAGFEVTKEFYINDRGRQIETLGKSVEWHWKKKYFQNIQGEFPADGYKGDYVKDLADDDELKRLADDYQAYLIKETSATGAAATDLIRDYACKAMRKRIEDDLKDFGINFDDWFSEKRLHEEGKVNDAIGALLTKGFVEPKDGAQWFRSETGGLGDDKDRVLQKADGELTYLASDVAYHLDKINRGFDTLINVWGADHHGYEKRIRAVFKAFGHDDAVLKIVFIQLVALLRNGEPVAMGKREGEFVTLRQVMDEVGADACRFFFLMRKSDAHLDFDLELAKKQAPENPVYYVQYCHARIKSIIEFAAQKGALIPDDFNAQTFSPLAGKDEAEIIRHLALFEETVERSALAMEPHRITFYLTELAGLFHPYYNKNRVVTDDPAQTAARLLLCKATGTVTANGLRLLGVSAPDKM